MYIRTVYNLHLIFTAGHSKGAFVGLCIVQRTVLALMRVKRALGVHGGEMSSSLRTGRIQTCHSLNVIHLQVCHVSLDLLVKIRGTFFCELHRRPKQPTCARPMHTSGLSWYESRECLVTATLHLSTLQCGELPSKIFLKKFRVWMDDRKIF